MNVGDWKGIRTKSAIAALFLILFGGYFLFRAATAGELTDVDARAAEDGQAVHADYLRVRGTPRWDLAVRGEDSDAHRLIVPVVSQEWTTTRPAGVFLEILDRDGLPDRQQLQESITGVRVIGRGFAHGIGDKLDRQGVRRTADPILFNANARPASRVMDGLLFIGLAGLLILICAAITRHVRHEEERRQARKEARGASPMPRR
jgi:hypothetical protein